MLNIVRSMLVVLSCASLLVSSQAQQKRETPQRAASPLSYEPELVSTAEADDAAAKENAGRTGGESEIESLQRTVRRLSAQVDRLSEELNALKTQQRELFDLERLSRAEQRADSLRAQLTDVQSREADLKARLEQLEYDLDPASIERRAALIGTTRPEEVREQIRRQLESERARLRSQLELLERRRQGLESAIARADAEIERLRTRLNEVDDEATPSSIESSGSEQNSQRNASPVTQPTRPPRSYVP